MAEILPTVFGPTPPTALLLALQGRPSVAPQSGVGREDSGIRVNGIWERPLHLRLLVGLTTVCLYPHHNSSNRICTAREVPDLAPTVATVSDADRVGWVI
jgi:hypothetical protein